MCQFYGTYYPCGCASAKGEYRYCEKRGEGCEAKFANMMWTTFCPEARKALRGRKYNPKIILPKCCKDLCESECRKLCLKCDSTRIFDLDHRPCGGHIVHVPSDNVTHPEKQFEKHVRFWPTDIRGRFTRRQSDPKAKGGWSV
ncbi:hypothetical protein M426DRAFT_12109 [Hypoxylon sp. CI-4A]|nr:hypothetical protein M426DRAFT_12109 [Hypoxylon sp. CI-4A]